MAASIIIIPWEYPRDFTSCYKMFFTVSLNKKAYVCMYIYVCIDTELTSLNNTGLNSLQPFIWIFFLVYIFFFPVYILFSVCIYFQYIYFYIYIYMYIYFFPVYILYIFFNIYLALCVHKFWIHRFNQPQIECQSRVG